MEAYVCQNVSHISDFLYNDCDFNLINFDFLSHICNFLFNDNSFLNNRYSFVYFIINTFDLINSFHPSILIFQPHNLDFYLII